MLTDRPETDAEDLEDVLIQVMNDEFDVVVDDESAAGVAGTIMGMREQVRRGEFGGIQQMWEDWERKSKEKQNAGAMFKRVEDQDQESSDDDDEEEEDEEDGDVEMGEAPELVRAAPREKVEPEVDEDGFTKVVGRRKR